MRTPRLNFAFRTFAALAGVSLLGASPCRAEDLLLANPTIIDGRGGTPFIGAVLIRDGRIARVCRRSCGPVRARRLDLTGRFLIPGLIDSHVHLATDPEQADRDAAARLEAAFRMGVTSVRDMAGDARALAALARGAELATRPVPRLSYAAVFGGPTFFADPRTRTASRGYEPGQAPWQRAVTPQVGAADLRRMIAAARATGARAIKLYADLDAPTVTRLTAEAHRQGMMVWSHAALFPAGPRAIIGAGVDSLSHSLLLGYELAATMPESYHRRTVPLVLPAGSAVEARMAALFRAMRLRGIVLDATLSVGRGLLGARPGAAGFADPAAAVRWSWRATRRALSEGVTVSAGSDSRMTEPAALHGELEILVRDAGLTPLQAITAATHGGARALGRGRDLGTIQPGRIADLVVLRRNPAADISALRSVERVIKGGAVHPGPLQP